MPVEGAGGKIVWIASLTNEYQVCRGAIDFKEIPGPEMEVSLKNPKNNCFTLNGSILVDKAGKTIVKDVWDYRVSKDCNRLLYIQKLSVKDKFSLLKHVKLRNLFYFDIKTKNRVLLGRVSRILNAYFPDKAQQKRLFLLLDKQ